MNPRCRAAPALNSRRQSATQAALGRWPWRAAVTIYPSLAAPISALIRTVDLYV